MKTVMGAMLACLFGPVSIEAMRPESEHITKHVPETQVSAPETDSEQPYHSPRSVLTECEALFKTLSRAERDDPKNMRRVCRDNNADERYFNLQDKLESHVSEKEGRKPRALIVGANNGVLADKLTPVIMAHDWEATLIEPVPQMFEELKANFATKTGTLPTGVKFLNRAVFEAPKEVKMSVDLSADGEQWNRGCSTVSEDGSPCQGFNKHEITVQGDTLANMLGTDAFDIVQIDVEGYDEDVLRQLDGLPWRPALLSIETCREFCQDWLDKNDYSLEWVHDAIGVAKHLKW